MTWYNVSLFQFLSLQDLLKIEDETDRLVSIAELLLGKDITELPIAEFNEKVKVLDFLKESIPEVNPPKKIEVNGRKYYTDCLLGNITTAQYVDYTNHCKTNSYNKILSVFVIPDGHKYNDGYDMLQVMNDINDLPIPIVISMAFFFERQLATFTKIFQIYLIQKIKKAKVPKELKKNMIQMVENSMDLALYLSSLNSVK